VLPGTVVFTVDIRSPEQAKLDRMRARIEARLLAWTQMKELPVRNAVRTAAANAPQPPRLKSKSGRKS